MNVLTGIALLIGTAVGLILGRVSRRQSLPAEPEKLTPVAISPEKIKQNNEQEKIRRVQQEKYSVLRDLGAGVSHEINNPLAIILGKTQMLKLKFERGEVPKKDIIDNLDKIELNAKRISKIVIALRMMTKDSASEETTLIAVASLFEDISAVWSERLKNKGYQFELPQIDSSFEIFGKRSLLLSALFNMISNSFEATQNLTERWIKIEGAVKNGVLIFSVTDAGTGIPEEVRKRLFDPFFTTRDAATSSGLGLAVSKGIFEVHKGSVEYDSASPNTKFIVHLPLAGMQDQKAG